MKLGFVSPISLVIYSLLLFASCKKDDSTANNNGDQDIAAAVSDEAQVTSEMDAIALDAGTAIEYDATFSGNNSTLDQIICDATVEYSTSTDPMTVTITYNGSNCGGGRARTGSIVLSMAKGTEWKNAGSSFTVTFNDLKITKLSTNKSITISGTHLVTNVSGGLLIHLATSGSITHTITSDNMKVSFDNGTERNWNVAKQRVYTYDNGAVLTITGTHTDGDESAIAEWGVNRAGAEFKTSTLSPIVVKQSCNFRITGGSIKHSTAASSAVVTFGLNISGLAIDCPGNGTFYYKLVWTGENGNDIIVILPY